MKAIHIATERRALLTVIAAYTARLITMGLITMGLAGCPGGTSTTPPSYLPRFAYVANYDDNTVSQYTVNAAIGQLRHNGYVLAGTNPISVTVDPSNKFAYVANANSNDVSAYTINPSSGVLSKVTCNVGPSVCNGSNFWAGNNPQSISVEPSGKFAYVTNFASFTVTAYSIDASTGALNHIGVDVPTGSNPVSLSVAPSGKFAYVANQGNSTVSAYTIDSSTGALTSAGATVSTGTNPKSLVVDPTGKFVYVANYGSASVSAFTINTSKGALTAVTGSPFMAGFNPASITTDPLGKFVYVTNSFNGTGGNSVSAYIINSTTGALAAVAGSPFAAGINPSSVTVDPSGKFAYVANSADSTVSTYTINNTSGSLAALSSVAGRSGNRAMAMSKGTAELTYTPKFAYVANYGSSDISAYSIDAGTGVLTSVGANVASGTNPKSLTVDPSGKFVYVANHFNGTGGNSVSAYTINTSTGVLTSAGVDVGTGTSPVSITVDPSGRFAYVANYGSANISTYTIDSTKGLLTSTGVVTAGTNPNSISIDPSGRFAYVANFGSVSVAGSVTAYSIDSGNGALAAVAGSPFAAGVNPASITVDPSGKFVYVANFGSAIVSAYTINTSNGVLMPLATVAVGTNPISITTDPFGKFVYVANYGSATVRTYAIDASTGALSIGSFVGTGRLPSSVSVDPSGRFAYVANYGDLYDTVSAYSIDAVFGTLSSVGAFGAGVNPASVTTTGTIQ